MLVPLPFVCTFTMIWGLSEKKPWFLRANNMLSQWHCVLPLWAGFSGAFSKNQEQGYHNHHLYNCNQAISLRVRQIQIKHIQLLPLGQLKCKKKKKKEDHHHKTDTLRLWFNKCNERLNLCSFSVKVLQNETRKSNLGAYTFWFLKMFHFSVFKLASV